MKPVLFILKRKSEYEIIDELSGDDEDIDDDSYIRIEKASVITKAKAAIKKLMEDRKRNLEISAEDDSMVVEDEPDTEESFEDLQNDSLFEDELSSDVDQDLEATETDENETETDENVLQNNEEIAKIEAIKKNIKIGKKRSKKAKKSTKVEYIDENFQDVVTNDSVEEKDEVETRTEENNLQYNDKARKKFDENIGSKLGAKQKSKKRKESARVENVENSKENLVTNASVEEIDVKIDPEMKKKTKKKKVKKTIEVKDEDNEQKETVQQELDSDLNQNKPKEKKTKKVKKAVEINVENYEQSETVLQENETDLNEIKPKVKKTKKKSNKAESTKIGVDSNLNLGPNKIENKRTDDILISTSHKENNEVIDDDECPA